MFAIASKQKELSHHQRSSHIDMKSFSKPRNGGQRRKSEVGNYGGSTSHTGGILSSLFGGVLYDDSADSMSECLRYMCSVERSSRPIKSHQKPTVNLPAETPVRTTQPTPNQFLDIRAPIISTLGSKLPKPQLLLTFIKGRQSCNSQSHLRDLQKTMGEATSLLGPGSLLCAIESASTAGMGDRTLWLPFIHNKELPEKFNRKQNFIKKDALGHDVQILQGYFEEHSTILLMNGGEVEDTIMMKESHQSPSNGTIKNEKTYHLNVSQGDTLDKQLNDSEFTIEASSTSLSAGVSRSNSTETIFPSENDQYITFIPKRKLKTKLDIDPESARNDSGYVDHENLPLTPKKQTKVEVKDKDNSISSKQLNKNLLQNTHLRRNKLEDTELQERNKNLTSDEKDSLAVESKHRPLIQFDNSHSYLLIGYKSLEGTPDSSLMSSWLRWSGTWDAYMMMQQHLLQVESMKIYTTRGQSSSQVFTYIVIIQIFTPKPSDIQLVKSISQRLRVERWKGYNCVYVQIKFTDEKDSMDDELDDWGDDELFPYGRKASCTSNSDRRNSNEKNS